MHGVFRRWRLGTDFDYSGSSLQNRGIEMVDILLDPEIHKERWPKLAGVKLTPGLTLSPRNAVLIGTVLFLAMAAIFLVRAGTGGSDDDDTGDKAIDSAILADANAAAKPVGLEDEIPFALAQAPDSDFMTQLDQLVAAKHEHLSAISALGSQVEALRDVVTDTATKHQLMTLEIKVSELAGDVDKLLQLQQSKAKSKTKHQPTKKKVRRTLPFSVLGIDLWEGRPFVAVSQNGLTELVPEGGRKGSWVVVDIQYQTGRVTFRDTRGRKIVKAIVR